MILNTRFQKFIFLLTFASHKINRIVMDTLLFLGNLRGWEIPIIAIVILLLFGGKKIPELMKGIGKGIKSFKDGMKEVEDEIKKDTE